MEKAEKRIFGISCILAGLGIVLYIVAGIEKGMREEHAWGKNSFVAGTVFLVLALILFAGIATASKIGEKKKQTKADAHPGHEEKILEKYRSRKNK